MFLGSEVQLVHGAVTGIAFIDELVTALARRQFVPQKLYD
jgi:hypothetical protein